MKRTIQNYIDLLVITGLMLLTATIINIIPSKPVIAAENNEIQELEQLEEIEKQCDVLYNKPTNSIESRLYEMHTEQIKMTLTNIVKIIEENTQETTELPTKEVIEKDTKENDDYGWETGIASAYGGWSDAQIVSNARTATGEAVTEYSMGVAIPLAWGRSDLYGHTVLIRYNGQTVKAKINDCGGMGGGSRRLDLQPGVFHEFGYDSCDEWGLRTVEYKIL